jgi:uncharacterized membrane protein
MASREPVPDLLKGFAVIAMIQVHIVEQFARPEILQGTLGKLSLFLGGPFAAPVFMAVMGYFAGKQGDRGTRGLGDKGKRGILLIGLGLLLNVGLNFNLLLHILTGKSDVDPWPYIFGVDILPLAGLSLIVIGICEMFLVRRAIAALALAIVVAAVAHYLPAFPEKLKYLGAFICGKDNWSYFPLFPWLAYPLLGYSWKRMEIEMPSLSEKCMKYRPYFLVLALVLLAALAVPSFRTITDLPAYYHHGILLFLWMIGFLVIWIGIGRFVINIAADSQITKYFLWLGENVTVVYVIQWLIIGNLAFVFYRSQYPIQLLFSFLSVLLLSSFFSYLYLKIRLLLWKKRS